MVKLGACDVEQADLPALIAAAAGPAATAGPAWADTRSMEAVGGRSIDVIGVHAGIINEEESGRHEWRGGTPSRR